MKLLYTAFAITIALAAWGVYLAESYTPPPSVDLAQSAQPPSAPSLSIALLSGVTATRTQDGQVTITWTPVQDVRVAGYRVYRDGTLIAETTRPYFADIVASRSAPAYLVEAIATHGTLLARSAPTTARTALSKTVTTTPSQPKPTSIVPQQQTPAPTTSPTPAPEPTPAPSSCGHGGACTAQEIASHSTRSDCWVYLSPINKTYNISQYVANGDMHPGGDVIVSHCGTNIYDFFIGRAGGHRHSSEALNAILQAYYIGPFQP